MKRLTTRIFVIAMMLGLFAVPVLNANDVSVFIDGERIGFEDQQPIFMGSGARTLVPIRAVFEALGFHVDWSPSGSVLLTRGDDEIGIKASTSIIEASNLASINGEYVPLGFPTMIFGDRTLVPVQGLLERMGHIVEWDEGTRTMNINSLMGYVSWDFHSGAFANQISPPEAGEEFAIIHTSLGEIHMRLFPELAPLAVENFVTLAQEGYYDGLVFHRIIEGFMAQGGCPYGTGAGGESMWGMPFGNETSPNLRHIRGALSMANAGGRSNNSQFFIVQADDMYYRFVPQLEEFLATRDEPGTDGGYTRIEQFPAEFEFVQHYLEYGGWPHLDFAHTVFGQVFEGMDVVDAIAAVQTDEDDRPLVDVIIVRIEIVEFEEVEEVEFEEVEEEIED